MSQQPPSIPPQGPKGLSAIVEAMRIPHWVKNSFVAAPILFSGKFGEFQAWERCLAAVAAFCLLSSCVYLINDVADCRSDQAHPVKRNRPIASGRLSRRSALIAAAVLLVAGLGIVIAVEAMTFNSARPLRGVGLVAWTVSYLVLNLLYSFRLKRVAILDVIMVAMGFVLRAMAGAAAIDVPISPWLVVCTFTLCLFIALTKRRSEVLSLSADQAQQSRRANLGYDTPGLEHMLTVSTALAILTYSLYCLAPRTIARFGSAHMVWTIPLVVYGMFRFNRTARSGCQSDVVKALVHDKVMWLVMAVYVGMVALILVYGGRPSIRDVLDIGN